jgi:putative cardiolipin synthase
MGLDPEFNFHDLDVMGIGPVARQASAVFDRYWNSGWAGRLAPPEGNTVALEPSEPAARAIEALRSDPRERDLLAGRRAWDNELNLLATGVHPGRGRVFADPPSRDEGSNNRMPEAFRALMRSARREVLITNAYVIPDEVFISDLRELAARGVKVRILTNSLASHDVPAVNAHYEGWRRKILGTGAALHELRADAAIRSELVDTPPVTSGFVGLHVKAMVVDRERSFIGSMNLDPRSEVFNAEMGVIIESPALGQLLAAGIERDLSGANSWQVVPTDDDTLVWRSELGERRSQPARSFWQRVENVLFKLMPASYY